MARRRNAGSASSKSSKAARAAKPTPTSVRMTFGVTPEKLDAIQRCLQKGKLTITVSSASILKGGRAGNGYLYD